jgi:hypothetical protein
MLMVKKIRVVEEADIEPDMTDEQLRQHFYETTKAMDWKLWEILQIMQRLEKRIRTVDDE